jgi:hypothetical protein
MELVLKVPPLVRFLLASLPWAGENPHIHPTIGRSPEIL